MAKLSRDGHTVETSIAAEIVALRSQGYAEAKHDKGAELAAAPVVVTNETGRAEAVKPAPKSTK